MLTDSGGLQEETTILGVPGLTLRHNTERPVTITNGTNIMVGPDRDRILEAFRRIMDHEWKPNGPPEYWDGRAAERIVRVLRSPQVNLFDERQADLPNALLGALS